MNKCPLCQNKIKIFDLDVSDEFGRATLVYDCDLCGWAEIVNPYPSALDEFTDPSAVREYKTNHTFKR